MTTFFFNSGKMYKCWSLESRSRSRTSRLESRGFCWNLSIVSKF